MEILQTYSYARSVGTACEFGIVPLKQFGAEIKGFDFINGPTPAQVKAMRIALVQHKMLLLRNKALSPQEQVALTRIFGSELHRAGPKLRYLAEFPEIFRISNRSGDGNQNTGQYWHSDGHYLADPSAVTVMHIVHATADGATLVADTQAAYERMPEVTKVYLAKHAFLAPETGISHPVIRRHPLTGKIGLYVNLKAIPVDNKGRQVPMVSEIINFDLTCPGAHYEHQWQEGETMIVDNFGCAHRGTCSDPKNLRIMHRTSTTGPSAWWRTGQ